MPETNDSLKKDDTAEVILYVSILCYTHTHTHTHTHTAEVATRYIFYASPFTLISSTVMKKKYRDMEKLENMKCFIFGKPGRMQMCCA
jgi:hypothetical protein